MKINSKNIFKINTHYKFPHYIDEKTAVNATGHWVLAESKEEALRVANKYKVGNPMGCDAIRREVVGLPSDKCLCLNDTARCCVLLQEVNGELISHKPPFNIEVNG